MAPPDRPESGTPAEIDIELIDLNDVLLGPTPRLRAVDDDHVELLVATGGTLPPILVHRATRQLIDGRHRLRAAHLRGDEKIEAELFDGDDAEAFAVSVQRNIAHGLPLSMVERKTAASRLLDTSPRRSDRWVASITGLSASTIGVLRKQRSCSEPEQQSSRLGADGRTRPVDAEANRAHIRLLLKAEPGASLRAIATQVGASPATVLAVRRSIAQESELQTPADRRETPPTTVSEHGVGETKSNEPRTSLAPPVHVLHKAPVRPRSVDDGSTHELIQKLSRDPSLRFSESGRELLRWVSRHAIEIDQARSLIRQAPPHCAPLLADFARECQEQWQKISDLLDPPGRGRPHRSARGFLLDIEGGIEREG